MINIYYRTIKDSRIRRLRSIRRGSWINVIDPSEREIKFLKRQKIDINFIEDALDPDELPRIEKAGGETYIILNSPFVSENGKVLSIPLLVLITKDAMFTICKNHLDWLKLILKKQDIYTTKKTKNLIQICIQITELYGKEIRRINKEIGKRKGALSSPENKDIIALVELEETLNEFITPLVSIIGVLEKILTGKYMPIFSSDEDLLEDLIIDANQGLDMCKTSIKKIVNIREAYSTILSNSLNKVMKILAFLTLIMGVSNIIAGFYGMNVSLPIQENPIAFFYLVSLSLILSLILILIFYFKKWI